MYEFVPRINKFFLIIFFLLYDFVYNAYLYFSFPTAIELKNKDILVVHQFGVTVCDSTFKHIKKTVYDFSLEEEQISDEDKLSRVSFAKFDDGYIFSIIIDKLYIFDTEGNFKNRTESLNRNAFNENLFFSLTSYKVEGSYYYYLVGYIYRQSLYLDYYKYCSTNIERIAYLENYYETSYFNDYKILNKGLSCEFLEYNYNTNYIVCGYYTYYSSNKLSLYSFKINGESIQKANAPYHYSDYINFEIKCIKSSVTTDRKSSIFCFYLSDGELFCYIYSLQSTNEEIYYYNVDCLQKYYGLKVDYYEEVDEFTVSCLADIGGFKSELLLEI